MPAYQQQERRQQEHGTWRCAVTIAVHRRAGAQCERADVMLRVLWTWAIGAAVLSTTVGSVRLMESAPDGATGFTNTQSVALPVRGHNLYAVTLR